ncbi:very short patch repair endonuclease [Mycobacteroides abscessus subsp. massiliense]|nr:very short patch repair endonuclease [Mycobacteroides abscessus subsp. massiliense]
MATSWASSEHSRAVMRGNRGRDTAPELAVRRLLHASGLRYRVHQRPLRELRRTADIVFSRKRIAVFIDGCYWHGCPAHHVQPKANGDYWAAKIAANVTRDRDTDSELVAAGWKVLRFWSHESPHDVCLRVRAAVLAAPRTGAETPRQRQRP